MKQIQKILIYIPEKYKNKIISTIEEFEVVFAGSYLDFLEKITEEDWSAVLIYEENTQKLKDAIQLSQKNDLTIIRILNISNEETLVESIKMGLDDCVSLTNLHRLYGILYNLDNMSSNNAKVNKYNISGVNQQLLAILDLLPNMVIIKDTNKFNYVYINKHGQGLLGLKKENLIGKNVFDILPENLAKASYEKDMLAIQSKGVKYSSEDIYIKHSGDLLYTESIKILVENENSQAYILEYFIDNTELNNLKTKLKLSDTRLDKIFNSSTNILVIEAMQTGKIIKANPIFEELVGFKSNIINNMSIKEVGLWIDEYKIDEMISRAIEQGSTDKQIVRVLDHQGEMKSYLLSLDYIEVDNKECILYIGQDVTDKNEGELELKKLLKKQKVLSELKNRFISLISHEFRTPLTTIMLSADLLKRYSNSWEQEEKNKHYDRIQQTILSMTKMLENVAILSRLEGKDIDLLPERINLLQFVQAMAESAIMNSQSTLTVNVDLKGENAEVSVDENLLGLSVIHTIYNSLKFTLNQKPINIEIEIFDKVYNIRIIDNGIGINETDMQYITQPFYRGDNSLNIPGYGLGLAITQKAVELLGGALRFHSTINQGTTVSISIPRNIL